MTDSGFSAFRAPQHTPTAEVTNEAARKRLAIDIAECRSMLRENSKTFFAASLLLPKSVREPASALYAFCRMADDAVDLAPVATKAAKLAAVEMLEERLERVYAGRPLNHAPDRAFAGVVAAFDIPRAVPNALIEGFLWDAEERRYASLDDLNAYATRVAGTVGAMMSILMRTRDADALARACDLGVAMQLSNIARDIGEDARMGRIYLPLDWLRDEGIDADEWLAAPQHSAALGRVVKRLLDEAATLYGRVADGVAVLPKSCQPGINAARFLYCEIGEEVARAGMDSVTRRAVVPASVKAKILTKAVMTSSKRATQSHPPLAACQFLVDACKVVAEDEAQSYAIRPDLEWWDIESRMAWLVEFLKRMEERDSANSRGR
jgi:15-cis-phytoene synthase